MQKCIQFVKKGEKYEVENMDLVINICDLLNNLSNRLLTSHEQFTNVGPNC